MSIKGVAFDKLPMVDPPIPDAGGRIETAAGELAQIINGQDFSFLAYIEFKENSSPRGNHYHTNKTETLYIIRGRLRALYKDLDTGAVEERILTGGDLVTVYPNCAHVYYTLEYSQALELGSGKFDPDDKVFYRIEDGS